MGSHVTYVHMPCRVPKTTTAKIKLTYQRVQEYSMEGFATTDPSGNRWIEDTLNLRKTDVLKHKVTLTGGNWTIKADDIEFSWKRCNRSVGVTSRL